MGSPRMIAECCVWCAGTSRASSALTVVLIPLITSFVRVVGEAAPVEEAVRVRSLLELLDLLPVEGVSASSGVAPVGS